MTQKHSAVTLVLFVALTTGLTTGLHQLDGGFRIAWSDPVGWFEAASVEVAIGGTMRTVGLTLGYWLVGSTTLYVLASRVHRRPRLVARVTLPIARRLADRAMATALVGSIVLSPVSPAVAEQPPPPPLVFDITSDGVPVPHIRSAEPAIDEGRVTEGEPADTEQPAPRRVDAIEPTPQTDPSRMTAATPPSSKYTVVPGDSLWIIAVREVEQIAGNDAATVSSYWRSVVAANRTTLRSGDPNLIYPGEIVNLPDINP